jgi:hypothetical protein
MWFMVADLPGRQKPASLVGMVRIWEMLTGVILVVVLMCDAAWRLNRASDD